jgi:hypothetical protein
MWYSNVLIELFQTEKNYLSGLRYVDKSLLTLLFVSNLFWHWQAAALPTQSDRLLYSKFVGLGWEGGYQGIC